MGCRHYFVADRLEDLVDEDDSQSSSRVTYLSVSLSFSKRSTNKLVFSQSKERNVYRFPEHSNGTFVLSQQVALFCELD